MKNKNERAEVETQTKVKNEALGKKVNGGNINQIMKDMNFNKKKKNEKIENKFVNLSNDLTLSYRNI